MTDTNVLYRLLRPPYQLLKAVSRPVSRWLPILWTLLERELTTGMNVDIPWRRRLWLYRWGFTSRSDALFEIDESNYRQFVSDLQHERANDITEPWDAVVNNKLTFYLLFGPFSAHLPGCYGIVDGGDLRRDSPSMTVPSWQEDRESDDPGVSVERFEAAAWIERHLDTAGALVLKPIYGQGGRDVLVCRRDEPSGGYRVNGEPETTAEFAARLEDIEEYLAWEFAEQADYAANLYPESVNTVRALTLWDHERDEPFLAGAVHRIGTDESAPVDNWSRGGLSAEIRDSGVLSGGAQWRPTRGEVRWYDVHPDTGARIEGVRVPDWSTVQDRILEMAAAFPYLPRLGWDIVLTGDRGFLVLEVNAHAATRTLQVHRPLLRDPRVKRFYEYHGCL
ncbi:MAG: sugar-transfer associated ATP-grasp domain-containing protein [Halolamina sp.]